MTGRPLSYNKLVQALRFEPTISIYKMCVCWSWPGSEDKADVLRGSRIGQWLNDTGGAQPLSREVGQASSLVARMKLGCYTTQGS